MKNTQKCSIVRVTAAAATTASVLTLALAATCFAQAPARSDKIMSLAELRTCMKLEQSNKQTAAEILQDQQAFKRDQEAVKAEQAEVNKVNAELRTRAAALASEREAISGLANGLPAKAEAAKSDADKAAFDAERARVVERSNAYDKDVERFNASQLALRDRVSALNERIDAINKRNETINDRVDPHQEKLATWREQCSKRRYREEDEAVVKKELAATK